MCALIVLHLVSSVLCQEFGWEERLQNDLFCVAWDVKPLLDQSINESCLTDAWTHTWPDVLAVTSSMTLGR